MIDVVEDHRLPLRCDAAREAAADRDTNPLLDLLLDPDRGPRHQLIRSLVEQQDRARVDGEDLAGAKQQRRQQSVELQMRERRIRERLKLPQPSRSCPTPTPAKSKSPFAALSIVYPPLRWPLAHPLAPQDYSAG